MATRRARKRREREAAAAAATGDGEEKKPEFVPNPPELDGVPDLSMLLYLEEDNVLHNLQCRYKHKQKKPYTSISTVLVAINPYERLPIYGPDKINQFVEDGQDGKPLDPHVFAVGARAYRLMTQKKKNQSIIVCGESGAGKSESAKYMMRFLAYTAEQAKASNSGDDAGDSMVEQQVLAATPILESFGNAKTVLNNNSSRFGKFTKLLFSNYAEDDDIGRILGSSLNTYLLEKSRVVHQDKNERNFHVFYQITKGADADFRKKYKVHDYERFHYINQGGSPKAEVNRMSDNGRFQELKDAFSLMRIDSVQQQSVFKMVAGILNLGNIEYRENDKSYSDIVPDTRSYVEDAAFLFGISADGLATRLTSRTIKVNLQTITSPLTMHEAPLNRDAMAKSLFSGIFQWLCRRINAELLVDDSDGDDEKGEEDMLFIGILDVFGFESFAINSFEQFCINFANERLQGFFNENIIASEQEEYIREGIFWKPLKVPDNSEMLVLVDDKRKGIFSLLDAACQMPKGTDKIFTQNLFQAHKKSKKIVNARAPSRPRPGQKWSEVKGSKGFNGFALNHYAGEVIYDAAKFLAKNSDFIHPDTAALFNTSSDANIVAILHDPTGGKKKRRRAFQSVGGNFSKGLTELMSTLRTTAPFFVRCVNPNNKQSNKMFDTEYVRKQLRCGGLIEALRVIKLGYPTRIPYIAIYKQYSTVLDHPLITNFGERDFCEAILVAFGLKEEHYEMGLTKVFFKPNRAQVLDEILDWGTRPLTKAHLERITTWIVSKRWKKLRGSLKAFMYLSWSLGSVKARRDFYRVTGIVSVYCQTFRKTLYNIREKIRVRNERVSVLTIQKLFRTHILQERWEKERSTREKNAIAQYQEEMREQLEMERLERERQEKLRIAKEKAEREEKERLDEIRRQREEREREELERQEREKIRLEEERKERERLKKIENERQRRLREEEEKRRDEQRRKEKEERERRIREEEERLKREAKEAELRRIKSIKDEDERQKAIIESKRKERDEQRKKILYMQRKMEEELASEMRKLEQLELEEDEERRRREEKLQREAEEKRRAEEAQNVPIMLQSGPRASGEAEPVSEDFLHMARTGQLFLKHTKGSVRKRSKPQERFVKISCLESGEPKNISWGSGDRCIEFSDVLYIVTGHVTQVFRNSSVDPTLCFSVVTPKRTLDLQAPDTETTYLWVQGLRAIMGHTREYSEEAAKNNVDRKVKKQKEREKKTKNKPVKERTNSMVLLQQDLFVMTVTTVFRHIEEEGMWIVPRDLAAKYPATDLYKQAVREKIPWRDWNEWIKSHIIEILEPTPKAIAHATGGDGEEKESVSAASRDSLSLSYPESSAADTEPSRSSRKKNRKNRGERSDSTGSDVLVDYESGDHANGDAKPRKSKKNRKKYGTLSKKFKNVASRNKDEKGDCKQQ